MAVTFHASKHCVMPLTTPSPKPTSTVRAVLSRAVGKNSIEWTGVSNLAWYSIFLTLMQTTIRYHNFPDASGYLNGQNTMWLGYAK